MREKRKALSWLLMVLIMITNVMPTAAQVMPLVISVTQSIHLENGQDAEMDFNVRNITINDQEACLITALYNQETNEMMHYNYIVQTVPANSEITWGACIPIPDQGNYKVKVFAWEDMKNLKLLSNVVSVGEMQQEQSYQQILQETATYLAAQTPSPIQVIGGEWSVLGLARGDYPVPISYYETYYQKLVTAVQEEAGKPSRPFGNKVTETQRIAMALTAMGKDPSNVNGINLLDYTWNKEKYFPGLGELGKRQGLNELVFGLIAIDLQQSEAPKDATITRDEIINNIMGYRTVDGGFSLSKGAQKADVDMTAMALQALAPYYETHAQVKEAVDSALDVLSQLQSQTGGFTAGDLSGNQETSESTAQVIVALTALGIDPAQDPRVTKGEHNPITNLLGYYAGNGQFRHTADHAANMMATEQCYYALVAYDRFVKGEKSLYDMTDVTLDDAGKITVSLEIDRSSIATEAVLKEAGYTEALAQPLTVQVSEGAKVVDVLVAAATQYGFDLQLDQGKGYVVGLDGIVDRTDAEAFGSLCEKFGLENIPGVYQYAGWMYEINNEYGEGINQDYVENGDQIDFRYTLYSGAGIGGEWVNFDWKFIDAYQELKKCMNAVEQSDYTGDELVALEKALDEANQVITTINQESQGMWIYYIGQKQTSLWGPGSPTEALENAQKTLQMAIDKVAVPTGIEVTPTGNLTLTMGEPLQLGVKVNPAHAPQEVTYELILGDEYIAVSDTGLITPLKEGNSICMIRVSSKVDPSINVMVRVNKIQHAIEKPVGKVSLSIEKRTIGKGDTLTLTEVDMFEGDTAWDVIKRETTARNIQVEASESGQYGSIYIASVDGDGEFDYGSGSGWKYSVNGTFPDKGVSVYDLKSGDTVRLRYCVTVGSSELERPLAQLLKTYIEEAKTYTPIGYTQESFAILQKAIQEAQVIADDQQYNTMETPEEIIVSQHIGKLIEGIKGLEKDQTNPLPPSDIPEDFANNICLNKDFLEMQIGDAYQIVARRLEEIVDNPFNNTITHPTYHYEVVKGNSVNVDDSGNVTAVKEGTSVIAITYDAITANGRNYGAISPINTGLFVVHVTDGTDTGIGISIHSEEEGVVKETRSYDTYYFTGDSVDYSFSVNVTNGYVETVKVNGQMITPQGSIYTAPLKNSGNIIEVVASNEKGKEVFAQVVDARKIEINIENLTDPTRNDAIEVGDEVKVSFRGITLPVYKLATIYNPSWSDAQYEPNGGAKVAYTCDLLGGIIKGKETQYDIATNNAIKFVAEEEGTYAFTGGHIDEGWWGDPLGAEKEMSGPDNPNMSAAHHNDVFSQLPDFSIVVGTAQNRPATGVEISKEIPQLEVGTIYQLQAKVLPENATQKTLVWSSADEAIATVNAKGELTAGAEGKVMISVQVKGTEITDQVEVTIIPEQPATAEEKAGLKRSIDRAQQLDESIYTTESWYALQVALGEAEGVYVDDKTLLAEVENAKNKLDRAIKTLVYDFSNIEVVVNPIEVTPGEQVTIYLPKLVVPNYTPYPMAAEMYIVYQSHIEGLEKIRGTNAYVGSQVDQETLRTVTLTIPETTTPGVYTLKDGYIQASSRFPQMGWVDSQRFYEGRMPEIQITVIPKVSMELPKEELPETTILQPIKEVEGYKLAYSSKINKQVGIGHKFMWMQPEWYQKYYLQQI